MLGLQSGPAPLQLAEDLLTGVVRDAGTSYLIYVALDDDRRPTPVPPLLLRTDEERARARAAEARRERRGREQAACGGSYRTTSRRAHRGQRVRGSALLAG